MATQAEISNIFPAMMDNFRADKAEGVDATIQFDLSGDNGGLFWVKISGGTSSHGEGDVEADMTVKAAAEDFFEMASGESNPMQAFMMGKLKVDDMGLGMKMIQIFDMG
jgi:putative sterol carrier protein